ncbi:discoidin domain-containing protein [Pseudoxanthomonas winnipegensis]|uniref:Discoidin domain-containing protein n=1 Tax=Pseudoxanthomonas winnipegensis TaxID=2480810 RepID=A0A4Q8M3W8_9GAMM|nr:discoidin domain-containing protein [Pseudoxanthomonas winnipegensis]TAA39674.1 discoidin domain-containing protein [Pseudoxanthomonas winnipegensis]
MHRTTRLSLCLLLAALAPLFPGQARADSAIYGGGPFYSGGTTVIDDLRASGFTTVMLWSVHVQSNGDLYLNDKLIVSNGSYVGDSGWPSRLTRLKTAPTSVTRIELSIGSAGATDFENIRSLINSQGTGSGSILYRNFQALKNATGANAVNFDDESAYDLASATAFGKMLYDSLGLAITFAPYTQVTFWKNLKSNLGDRVDGVYLQVYDGGAGNDPKSWSDSLGITVDPGLWSRHGSNCASGDSPASVNSRMSAWKSSAGIAGGFIWLYDDIQACAAQGTAADYAGAINQAVSSGTGTASPNLAYAKTATGSSACNANETPAKAVNGSVSGGTSDKFCSLVSGAWLRVDLGSAKSVKRVIVRHAGAGGESTALNTRAYTLQVSADASTWSTVASASSNTANVSTHDINPVTARYVQLKINTPTQNGDPATRIYELEVY